MRELEKLSGEPKLQTNHEENPDLNSDSWKNESMSEVNQGLPHSSVSKDDRQRIMEEKMNELMAKRDNYFKARQNEEEFKQPNLEDSIH